MRRRRRAARRSRSVPRRAEVAEAAFVAEGVHLLPGIESTPTPPGGTRVRTRSCCRRSRSPRRDPDRVPMRNASRRSSSPPVSPSLLRLAPRYCRAEHLLGAAGRGSRPTPGRGRPSGCIARGRPSPTGVPPPGWRRGRTRAPAAASRARASAWVQQGSDRVDRRHVRTAERASSTLASAAPATSPAVANSSMASRQVGLRRRSNVADRLRRTPAPRRARAPVRMVGRHQAQGPLGTCVRALGASSRAVRVRRPRAADRRQGRPHCDATRLVSGRGRQGVAASA